MPKIGGRECGPGNPLIVAEIGCNHNGDLATALRLVEEACAAGAGAIKFQCYTLREILDLRDEWQPVPEPWKGTASSMRELYVKARTPTEWFPELIAACGDVPWFSSVFGPASLDLMVGLGCPAFKVAALDAEQDWFTALVCGVAEKLEKPVIASSRGERIPWANVTLFCPPGYPQLWPHAAWQAIVDNADCDGLSYHGTQVSVPLWAKQAASMIEVHVQLDDEPSHLDAHSSLTISQLRELCQ